MISRGDKALSSASALLDAEIRGSDSSVRTSTITADLIHELGADLTSHPIDRLIFVPASPFNTQVKVRSRVIADTAKRFRSAEYVATLRRREAATVMEMIEALGQHVAREDFFMTVHGVVAKIKAALVTLREAEHEGNSREILRQLRDSMTNGRWNSYKEEPARVAAKKVISLLAHQVEVSKKDAFNAANTLEDAGLEVIGLVITDDK